MRFVITLLCVSIVAFVALALVVIEAVIKLLPVLIAVTIIVVVARRLLRRRGGHGPARWPAHAVNVPGESAFPVPPSIDRALTRRHHPPYPYMIIDGQLGSEGPPRD